MQKEFKPEGYNSLSPYFIVNDCPKMVDLLKGIFNAKELRKYENADGTIMHMELQIDDSVIMLGEASESYPANQFLIHVYVPDVLATFKKAIDLGCETVEEPVNKPGDPDMRGSFKDYQGNMWAIGTQVG
jgi:PhnB protein